MEPQSAPSMPYNAAVTLQVQQPTTDRESNSRYLLKIWRTAVVHIVGGVLLVCLGIVAIILLGFWSYFATPIWTGLVIFVLTGCFGMKAASTGHKCWTATYITMSVFATMTAASLVIMYSYAAVLEQSWWYDYYGYSSQCQPGNGGTYITNCAKSEAARQTFDALIAVTGFSLFILSIVSASYGCCANCDCSSGCASCCQGGCCSGCTTCCTPVPKPATAVFMANRGHGTAVAPAGQPGMYLVQPNQTVAYLPQAGAMTSQQQPAVLFTTTQQPAVFQQQQYQQQQQPPLQQQQYLYAHQQQQPSLQQQQQYLQLQQRPPMQQQQQQPTPQQQQQQQQQQQAALYQQEKDRSALAQAPPSYAPMPPPQ